MVENQAEDLELKQGSDIKILVVENCKSWEI